MHTNQPPKSRREEYGEATRQALLSAARAIFTQEGYQAANIETISRTARVTRGAFYYYFADKKTLFDAVVVMLQAEAAQAVAQRAREVRERWAQLHVGISAYLDACGEPAYRRLVIQEAPAVLGTTRAREIDDTYPLALLVRALKALEADGELACEDVELLSRMLGAMICEVALLLPDAASQAQLRDHALASIKRILMTFHRV